MVEVTSLSINVETRTAQVNLARLRGAVTRTSAGFDKFRRSLFSVKSLLATGAGAIVTRQLLQSFSDFEKGLIGVGKTADIAGKDLQDMGASIQQLAGVVPIATTELLEIAQAAGQLGIKGSDNILKFTETVGKLTLATNLGGEEAATTLARILTVTGTAVQEVDKFGSVIVQLGNNFAATESEIASVAIRIAQATAQFKVSSTEAAAFGAALTAVGVQAEAGGTVIGRAFQSINDALRNGGEELEALQEISGETREALEEAFFSGRGTQVFTSFVEGLGRIQARGGDVAAAISRMGLEGVRVIGVLGTLATRSEVLAKALKQANEEFNNATALNKEVAVATKSFASQMQLLKSTINGIKVEIGAELVPTILELAGAFREWVKEAKESGKIKEFAQDVGNLVRILVDNAEILFRVAGALTGIALLGRLGPKGVLVGAVIGGLSPEVLKLLTGAPEEIKKSIDGQTRLNDVLETRRELLFLLKDAQERLAFVEADQTIPKVASRLIGEEIEELELRIILRTREADIMIRNGEALKEVNIQSKASINEVTEAIKKEESIVKKLSSTLENFKDTILDLIKTPMERFTEQQEMLNQLFKAGAITLDQYNRAIDLLQDELVETDPLLSKLESTMVSFSDSLIDGAVAGENAFETLKNTAINAIRDITKELAAAGIRNLLGDLAGGGGGGGLFGGLGSLFSGFFGGGGGGGASAITTATAGGGLLPFAKGGVFNSGNITPFANGGIVRRPTLFPMANGAGLMGEAGPEAIIPLKRGPGGKLGIQASGGGGGGTTIILDLRGSNGDASIETAVERGIRRASPGLINASVQTLRGQAQRDPDFLGTSGL